MEIIYNNITENIENIINQKAKFQKVMLLFGEYVSNVQIQDISTLIKPNCIYNQMNINKLDLKEISNGYKLIIYLCNVNEFIKLNLNKEEFINVFVPTDTGILPYFLNNLQMTTGQNYLLLQNQILDINIVSSVSFNTFFTYTKQILTMQTSNIDIGFYAKEITSKTLLENLSNLTDIEFVDIEILKQCNIEYDNLMLVDLLLINAFIVMLSSIKNNQLMLVDVYKATKENYSLIDKFYAMANNDAVLQLITLNYNCLYSFAVKAKEQILQHFVCKNVNNEMVENIVIKLKNYLKNCDNILGYLYVFNIFDF